MRNRIKVPMPRGCSAVIIDRGDHIELATLVVRHELRGRGVGTNALKRIQAFGRRQGRRIRLEAVPFDGWKKQLHRFYKRMGFTRIPQGRRTFFEWTP